MPFTHIFAGSNPAGRTTTKEYMITLPAITTKVANDTLAPYFQQIEVELSKCESNTEQRALLQKYRIYIEQEARKTKNIGVRMQLRINMRALQNSAESVTIDREINVLPKQSLSVPLSNRLRLAHIL